MCHENKMGAAKNSTHIEQYKLSKDSGTAVEQGTVTRPLFINAIYPIIILYHDLTMQSITTLRQYHLYRKNYPASSQYQNPV